MACINRLLINFISNMEIQTTSQNVLPHFFLNKNIKNETPQTNHLVFSCAMKKETLYFLESSQFCWWNMIVNMPPLSSTAQVALQVLDDVHHGFIATLSNQWAILQVIHHSQAMLNALPRYGNGGPLCKWLEISVFICLSKCKLYKYYKCPYLKTIFEKKNGTSEISLPQPTSFSPSDGMATKAFRVCPAPAPTRGTRVLACTSSGVTWRPASRRFGYFLGLGERWKRGGSWENLGGWKWLHVGVLFGARFPSFFEKKHQTDLILLQVDGHSGFHDEFT